MLKVSLRNVLANKLRLFLTVAAVTVGVAFVSGTFVLSDTMSRAFDQLFTGLTAGTDVVVRGRSAYDTGAATMAQPRPIDQGLVDEIGQVPGVAVAEGGVTGFALILDADGAPVQPGGAPTLGMQERLTHRPAQLSGGQQQRVAVARALVSRPEVVFADEPTGALDSKASAELLRFLRSVVDGLGQTVVMVTHDPVAAAYADRVVFLVDGSVVEELAGPTRDSVLETMKRLGG